MSNAIAETLILTMTRGMSLAEWRRLGLIEREWALYERLADSYQRIVVVSHGAKEDLEIASGLPGSPTVIINDEDLDTPTYVATLHDRIDLFVGPVRDAVIKTNQMDDGGASCALAAGLRERGTTVGLIARCGYLWSQFVARARGPGSAEAISAALIEQAVTGSADLVVGTTREIVDDLSWRDGLAGDRVRVIPNYVITEGDPLPAEDRVPGLAVYVGQLCARKRVDHLIRAVAEQPKDEGTRLEIFGEGPQLAELEALAARLGADVRFLGQRPHAEVLARLRQASVYLHASSLEGHPKSVIEAMACGTPCIVADAPGLGSLIENGVTGIRVPGEPETFAYALAGVLGDTGWRDQLGMCASDRARKTFGIERVMELEREAHAAALSFGRAGTSRAAPMIRWNAALLQHGPDRIAQSWLDAYEMLLGYLPESRRAALVEAIGKRKNERRAA